MHTCAYIADRTGQQIPKTQTKKVCHCQSERKSRTQCKMNESIVTLETVKE